MALSIPERIAQITKRNSHKYFNNRPQIIFIILINLIFIDTLFSKTHPQIDGLKNIK